MEIIPITSWGYCNAEIFEDTVSSADSTIVSGCSFNEENFKRTATSRNANPNIK